DDELDEASLLEKRTGRVFVSIAFGEPRKVGQWFPALTQKLEVLRLHASRPCVSLHCRHARLFSKGRAINRAPRTSSASLSESGSSVAQRVPPPWSCCRGLHL